MPRVYEVILSAQVTIKGRFTANSAGEAVETAKAELLTNGQVLDVVVERQLLLDDDDKD